MNLTGKPPKVWLNLLPLTFALATTGCATSLRAVKPAACPAPQPAPANVMREPSAEKRLRLLLFVLPETPTTSSAPAKPL